MSSISKKVKGMFIYLVGGYKLLSNWPAFYADLIRFLIKVKTKCELYKFRDGTKIRVHPNSKGLNYVFYSAYLKREYDGLKMFEIKADDIVIDIGAHLGFFTIKAAKTAVNGTVYAFEPFSMHYKLLEENIVSNQFNNVKLFNRAVTDKDGELSFFYTMIGDPGDTSLFKINPEEKTYEEKVKTISLQDFFQKEKLDRCDFLKIDCEGAEYSILMSADRNTLNKIQKIAMEWHRFEPEQSPQKLAEFLKENGFNLIEPFSYDQMTGFLFAYR